MWDSGCDRLEHWNQPLMVVIGWGLQFKNMKTNKSAEVENHAKQGNYIFGRRKMARLLTNSEE